MAKNVETEETTERKKRTKINRTFYVVGFAPNGPCGPFKTADAAFAFVDGAVFGNPELHTIAYKVVEAQEKEYTR